MKTGKVLIDMDRKRIFPLAAGGIALGAVVPAVVCRITSLLTHFDKQIEYFDTSLPSVLHTVLCFAAVILPVICMCCTPKDTLTVPLPSDSRDLTALLPLAGFTFFAVMCAGNLSLFSDMKLRPEGSPNAVSTAVVILIICAVGGIAYAFGSLAGMKNRTGLAAIGFLPIIWGIVLVAASYLDQYTAMNSPLKIGLQFGTLSVMLALTAELRCLLDKAAPRAYVVLTGIAAFFCLDNGISYTVAAAVNAVKDRPLYLYTSVLHITLGLYFAIRLVRCLLPYLHRKEETDPCA